MKGVCRGGGHGSSGTSPVFLFSPLSCVSLLPNSASWKREWEEFGGGGGHRVDYRWVYT